MDVPAPADVERVVNRLSTCVLKMRKYENQLIETTGLNVLFAGKSFYRATKISRLSLGTYADSRMR